MELCFPCIMFCIYGKSSNLGVEIICTYESYIPINLLEPNDTYICRTAALTDRRYILNIYSTNIHTEYFKHAA